MKKAVDLIIKFRIWDNRVFTVSYDIEPYAVNGYREVIEGIKKYCKTIPETKRGSTKLVRVWLEDSLTNKKIRTLWSHGR